MPARETEAIILKTFPLGEADRLVSFLGRSSGRMRGVAAGARRIKNRYGSALQLLSHVHIWYVERETRDLVRIQQADLLESFNKAQSDYSLSTSLALVSEVMESVLPEHEVNEAMFRLVLLTAREIERLGNSALAVSYFAFWAVRLAGWLPRFDVCAVCGKPFGKSQAYQAVYHPGLRQAAPRPVGCGARYTTGCEGTARSRFELDRAPHGAQTRHARVARNGIEVGEGLIGRRWNQKTRTFEGVESRVTASVGEPTFKVVLESSIFGLSRSKRWERL